MAIQFTPEEDIHSFFGTSLLEYYLTIDAGDLSYHGEGYAIVGQNDISFFDDKMQPVYSIELSHVLTAKVNGIHRDDITMQFKKNVSINAER